MMRATISECFGCDYFCSLEDRDGNIDYFCMNTDSGSYVCDTGLCGLCGDDDECGWCGDDDEEEEN